MILRLYSFCLEEDTMHSNHQTSAVLMLHPLDCLWTPWSKWKNYKKKSKYDLKITQTDYHNNWIEYRPYPPPCFSKIIFIRTQLNYCVHLTTATKIVNISLLSMSFLSILSFTPLTLYPGHNSQNLFLQI